MPKNKTNEQKLMECAQGILESIRRWEHIFQYGASDPGWPDGANMNLVRNHVISYKRQIDEICEETGLERPSEYYTDTPPHIDENYFADLKSERAKSIMSRPGWKCHNHEPTTIDKSGQIVMI